MDRDEATREGRQAVPDAPSDGRLRELLREVRSIAVIGANPKEDRPAHYVPAYMSERGYEVVGVGPRAAGRTLFGNEAVETLADLDSRVDMVNVFRRNEDIPGHLDDILALDPLPRAVWIQLGLRNDEVAERLRAEGIEVIQDRCLMVEHRRLLGADASAGVSDDAP